MLSKFIIEIELVISIFNKVEIGCCQAKWYPFQTTKSDFSKGKHCPIKTIKVSACREGPICTGHTQQKSIQKKGRGCKFKNTFFFDLTAKKSKKLEKVKTVESFSYVQESFRIILCKTSTYIVQLIRYCISKVKSECEKKS